MSVRFGASITMMFQEAPFLERFELAKASGFEGVEIQDMRAARLEDLGSAANGAGVSVSLINVDIGDAHDGGLGLSGVPGREHLFDAAVGSAIEAAHFLSVPVVHVGPCRCPDPASREAYLVTYLRNIEHAVRRAEDAGCRLVIEALNRLDAPDVLLGDLDAAAEIARQFGPKLGLLFDAYHVARSALNPAEAFEACVDVVAHVQIADAPGRHAPGSGVVDFPAFFRALGLNGYSGWVGAEYRPAGPTSGSLGWMAKARAELRECRDA